MVRNPLMLSSQKLYGLENEEECLKQMTDFLGSREGYITYECPPQDTYGEFKKRIM